MPLTARIDNSTNTVTFNLAAPTATVDEMVTDYARILGEGNVTANMHSIWDISELDLKRIPLNEIRRLPREMAKRMGLRGTGFKVAIVASGAGDQWLLRMYLSVIKLIGLLQFRLFTSVEDAQVWVNGSGKR